MNEKKLIPETIEVNFGARVENVKDSKGIKFFLKTGIMVNDEIPKTNDCR